LIRRWGFSKKAKAGSAQALVVRTKAWETNFSLIFQMEFEGLLSSLLVENIKAYLQENPDNTAIDSELILSNVMTALEAEIAPKTSSMAHLA
jgi:hypothetical protein